MEDSLHVYNFMIGKQLADVLTRCSSHPQGESEARCQNMHSHVSTAAHSSIHVTGGWGATPRPLVMCILECAAVGKCMF